MTEQFAFVVNDQTLTFADLKTNYGLFLRNIEQSASVSWDIATSKNPYIDGSQVNNRTANSREMVIEFGYDRKVEPADADAALFSYFAAADDGEITVKKTRGNVNKYIDGVIRDISQEVYTDEPVLQIVLFTDPFWRGEQITLTKNDFSRNAETSRCELVVTDAFEGEAQTGFRYQLMVTKCATAYDAAMGCELFDKSVKLGFSVNALPFTKDDKSISSNQYYIISGDNLECKERGFYTVPPYTTPIFAYEKSIVSGISSDSQNVKLKPHTEYGGIVYMDNTTADGIFNPSNNLTVVFTFSYTPLYIR